MRAVEVAAPAKQQGVGRPRSLRGNDQLRLDGDRDGAAREVDIEVAGRRRQPLGHPLHYAEVAGLEDERHLEPVEVEVVGHELQARRVPAGQHARPRSEVAALVEAVHRVDLVLGHEPGVEQLHGDDVELLVELDRGGVRLHHLDDVAQAVRLGIRARDGREIGGDLDREDPAGAGPRREQREDAGAGPDIQDAVSRLDATLDRVAKARVRRSSSRHSPAIMRFEKTSISARGPVRRPRRRRRLGDGGDNLGIEGLAAENVDEAAAAMLVGMDDDAARLDELHRRPALQLALAEPLEVGGAVRLHPDRRDDLADECSDHVGIAERARIAAVEVDGGEHPPGRLPGGC